MINTNFQEYNNKSIKIYSYHEEQICYEYELETNNNMNEFQQ